MVIEESDFRLESIDDATVAWDTYLIKTVHPKSGGVKEELQLFGYGLPLQHAMYAIVQNRLSRRHPEAVDMKTYITEFKKEMNELHKVANF